MYWFEIVCCFIILFLKARPGSSFPIDVVNSNDISPNISVEDLEKVHQHAIFMVQRGSQEDAQQALASPSYCQEGDGSVCCASYACVLNCSVMTLL